MPWISLFSRPFRRHGGPVSLESAVMGGGLLLTLAVVSLGFGPALDAVTQRVHLVLDASGTDAPAPPGPALQRGG